MAQAKTPVSGAWPKPCRPCTRLDAMRSDGWMACWQGRRGWDSKREQLYNAETIGKHRQELPRAWANAPVSVRYREHVSLYSVWMREDRKVDFHSERRLGQTALQCMLRPLAFHLRNQGERQGRYGKSRGAFATFIRTHPRGRRS